MGMFDYVVYEGRRYQTKDTPDQYTSVYRIVRGRLLDETNGDLNWNGQIDLISEDPPYADYIAVFKDGSLVDFSQGTVDV